jgi:hypothetical protein
MINHSWFSAFNRAREHCNVYNLKGIR